MWSLGFLLADVLLLAVLIGVARMSDDFDGGGFDRSPLNEDENAQFRQIRAYIERTKPTIDAMDNLSKGAASAVKIFAAFTAIGAAALYLSNLGGF